MAYYKILQEFGNYKVGQVLLEDTIYLREMVKEGCAEVYIEPEQKMVKDKIENKAIKSSPENK
jgi:hypothetical protein